MSRFENKVVLITGGRSGIGKACAKRFAAEGATVITAQRSADETFEHIEADFLDPATPEAMISEVISRHERLDVLVNNAGLMREGTALESSTQDWADTIQVNLTAPFLLTKFALPHLI